MLLAASCSRELLQNNYIVTQNINLVPSFIVVGIFTTTLFAALSNLIGASRVLLRVAEDRLFGSFWVLGYEGGGFVCLFCLVSVWVGWFWLRGCFLGISDLFGFRHFLFESFACVPPQNSGILLLAHPLGPPFFDCALVLSSILVDFI